MYKIIKLLERTGPLTGKEMSKQSGMDELSLWRICNKSDEIILKTVGKRFLRLDSRIKGYARLSPSIKREFLTYTVAGLKKDSGEIKRKASSIYQEIKKISRQKLELAREVIKKIVTEQEKPEILSGCTCFIIAGDIVYGMAHAEPRPETSINEIVKGSDLDIIVVTENLPRKILEDLDRSIYQQKYYLIKSPSYREEIDYIIKDIQKVRVQLSFNNFKFMVASKILYEGKFLYGSTEIFKKIKKMLSERKIPEKLLALEKEAITGRENAESYLLESSSALPEEECMKLFYTKQEKEEIF
jgi:vacuolar-type H+-ATPase subunit F/Vma7